MLNKLKPELRYPAEFGWLLALVFFLPLFEAPKNLSWLGYVITWAYNRARDRNWGGPWDRWDNLLALWIASGYLVAAFAGIRHDEWSGANDMLRYGSLLWFLKRSRYSESALLWVLGTVIASTLVALFWGYWKLYVAKTSADLGLNSVGHVNHSAIYMAIVLGVALGLTTAYWKRIGTACRAMLGVAVAALLVSVFVTGSRAAAGAAVLFVLVFIAALGVRRRIDTSRNTLLAMLGIAVVLAVFPSVLDKTIDRTERGLVFSFRDKIWTNGLVEWRQFPLFGVGMGNFGHVTLEQLHDWSKSQNWDIRPSGEGINSHGHSLYLTALAERGLIGFGILIAVLLTWGRTLQRGVPGALDPPLDWALFGSALAAWLITVLVGIVNTTLHHEHGILAALLLGLWLARREAPERVPLQA